MKKTLIIHVFLFIFFTYGLSQAETSRIDQSKPVEPVRAALISDVDMIELGKEYSIGIIFEMSPGWHIYWTYPGNTGKPTRIIYTTDPIHTRVLDPSFPTPSLFDPEPIDSMSFGYKDTIMVPSRAMTYSEPTSGKLTIFANVSWLACNETCIPGKSELKIDIPAGQNQKNSKWKNLFEQAYQSLPTDIDRENAYLKSFYLENGVFTLVFALDGFASVERFIPKWIHDSTCRILSYEVDRQANQMITATIRLGGSDCLPGAGSIVVGRLHNSSHEARQAFSVDAKTLTPQPKATAPQPQVAPVDSRSTHHPPPPTPRQPIGWMLLFAFLGGLLLNIMPCVIPVVVPKLLHVVRSVREIENPLDKSRLLWQNALVYAAGVLATMLALSLLVVVLKYLGHEAGWGFQFQNPWFLVFMISLLLLAGLGMLKTFSLKSSRHTDNLKQIKKIRRSNPLLESFLTGLLVTFLGTPCTAPFLGPALGYAFSQSSPMIVVFLLIVGLGLSSPFLLLGLWTGWTRLLPSKVTDRYDRTMRVMAFLFFATAIWLLGVLADGYGVMAMKNTLWFLLAMALCAWLYGLWTHDRQTVKTRLLILTPLLVVLIVIGMWILNFPNQIQAASPSSLTSPVGIAWQPFSEDKIRQLRTQGKSVFVDFTAEWCLNCKANERLIIEQEATKKLFDQLNIAAVKADHTRFDPVIMQWLKRFHRAGVPMYLVFPACKSDDSAILLPEILTREVLNQALLQAGPSQPGCTEKKKA